ncbi:MAG: endolytic transglycosylase MltG [Solirubrobacteraceae bacterium]
MAGSPPDEPPVGSPTHATAARSASEVSPPAASDASQEAVSDASSDRERSRRRRLSFPRNAAASAGGAGRLRGESEEHWDPRERLLASRKRPPASGQRASASREQLGKPGTSATSRPRGANRQQPRHRLWPRLLVAGVLVAVILILVFVVLIFQPFSGKGNGRVTVVIPKGATSSEVGSILAKDGVIESSFFFDVRTFLDGSRGSLHAGTYTLRRGMSYGAAIAALSNAKAARAAIVKIVIPEGETRVQIARTAKRDGLKGSYMNASRRASNFPPGHYGAPTSTPNLEGFLFPATYQLDKGAPVSELVQQQLVAFSERFGEAATSHAKALKLTPYQLLIVASMIEREAQLPHDRPLVAAVIYNRLRAGMALGIDATIRFALNDYEKPLTEAQLHIDSPYNTRTHKGLPPTPISNPGTEAIEAAAHPAHAAYLYYVNGADGCGDLVFSDTYAEFERNSAEYNEAIERNGGHVPACKH